MKKRKNPEFGYRLICRGTTYEFYSEDYPLVCKTLEQAQRYLSSISEYKRGNYRISKIKKVKLWP